MKTAAEVKQERKRNHVIKAALLAALLFAAAANAQVFSGITPTFIPAPIISGAITTNSLCAATGSVMVANGCVVLQSPGTSTAQITVSGTYTGAQAFQCLAADGSTWNPAAGPVQSIASGVTGSWSVSYAGCTGIRVVPTAAMTGTANVSIESSATAPAPAMDPFARPISGNSNRATYHTTLSITVPTAAASLAAIESDGTNKTRLRYIKVCLGTGALQTTAGARNLVVFRTTAASSGGALAASRPRRPSAQ